MNERDIVRQKAVDGFIISEQCEFMTQIHVLPLLMVSRPGTRIIVNEKDMSSSNVAIDTREHIRHLGEWNGEAFNVRLRSMKLSIQVDGENWGLGANWGEMFSRCYIRHGAVLSLWVLIEEDKELKFLFRLDGYVPRNGIFPSLRKLQQAACQGVAPPEEKVKEKMGGLIKLGRMFKFNDALLTRRRQCVP